jgi:hypothetical protein
MTWYMYPDQLSRWHQCAGVSISLRPCDVHMLHAVVLGKETCSPTSSGINLYGQELLYSMFYSPSTHCNSRHCVNIGSDLY